MFDLTTLVLYFIPLIIDLFMMRELYKEIIDSYKERDEYKNKKEQDEVVWFLVLSFIPVVNIAICIIFSSIWFAEKTEKLRGKIKYYFSKRISFLSVDKFIRTILFIKRDKK